jgi:DNA uptake protein ComE-like DNA-binding protein
MRSSVKLGKLREFFIFTEKEKRGIMILLCLIFFLIFVDILLPLIYHQKNYDFTQWQEEIDGYLTVQDSGKQKTRNINKYFNPNEVDSAKLINQGVSLRISRNWCRYLAKGGRFKKKEEVNKIFGMTPELYQRLEKYMIIPDEKKGLNNEENKAFKKGISALKAEKTSLITAVKVHKKKIEPINLNEADSAALENLPGIGPVLASRIIRFRKILGGFYSIDQLNEVYGLRYGNYSSVAPWLYVRQEGYRKFNLNFSTLAELGHHPYIGFRTAHKILELRERKGKFAKADELSILMRDDSLKRLAPYLEFGP